MPPDQINNQQNLQINPTPFGTNQDKQPHHKWLRWLLISFNIVPPVLSILMYAWLSYEQSLGVSGTEFIALIFAPIFGIFFLTALIIDTFLLIKFLIKTNHSPADNKRKRILAKGALLVIILIMCGSATSLIINIRQENQSLKQSYLDDGNQFKSDYQKAKESGFGFNIFLPVYVPRGYSYLYGQMNTASSPSGTGFEVHYQNPGYNTSTYDFYLDMFKTPLTFAPPKNCTYPLSPPQENDPDTMAVFPCSSINSMGSDSAIYYALATENIGYLPPTDVYYTTKSGTLISLSSTRATGSLDKADAIKILNSLQETTLDTVVSDNIKADKQY